MLKFLERFLAEVLSLLSETSVKRTEVNKLGSWLALYLLYATRR